MVNRPGEETVTEPKSARTRRRIMDVTARMLSQRGYNGTRLQDVAREAELQAPTLYYYFSSREELIEAVVRDGVATMTRHVTTVLECLPPGTPPMERIAAAVEAHLRLSLEISTYTTAAIRNTGQLPDHMRERQQAAEAEYAAVWRDLFRAAETAGVLRGGVDTRTARLLVLGALNWASEWWDPERGSLEGVVRTAQTIVHQGLSDIRPAQLVPKFLPPES